MMMKVLLYDYNLKNKTKKLSGLDSLVSKRNTLKPVRPHEWFLNQSVSEQMTL